jgi:hypothetical protein
MPSPIVSPGWHSCIWPVVLVVLPVVDVLELIAIVVSPPVEPTPIVVPPPVLPGSPVVLLVDVVEVVIVVGPEVSVVPVDVSGVTVVVGVLVMPSVFEPPPSVTEVEVVDGLVVVEVEPLAVAAALVEPAAVSLVPVSSPQAASVTATGRSRSLENVSFDMVGVRPSWVRPAGRTMDLRVGLGWIPPLSLRGDAGRCAPARAYE